MWWQAYFVVSLYAVMLIPALLHRPFLSLAQERARFIRNPGTAGFDKVIAPLTVFLTLLAYFAAGLQHRVQPGLLSGPFGGFCSHVGVLSIAAITDALSLLFVTWCMAVNAWFSSVVRIQSNRGHKVCNSGPYKYVRHPGYIGFVVQGFAEAILLQSSWTAALAFMRTTLLVVRSVKEEQFLMANLPGYTEYAAQVRYRWVPYVW
jgi:protein-S-isoprenylcysteine O-methyltransferase Ste14